MDKTLLIDGDIILFKMAFRHQRKVFGEIQTDSIEEAKADVDDFINELIENTKVVDYLVCLSSYNNFRKEVWPAYKAARKEHAKPKLLGQLRAYVETQYATLSIPTLEADDVIGILASQDYKGAIIATTDKDMLQIHGLHYDWRTDEFFKVTPEEGLKFFYQQVLSGDPADGYKGCPRIGKIKAKRIVDAVEDPKDYWRTIVETYEAHGSDEAEALLNAQMAFILDKHHWDKHNEKVILWEPGK